MRPYLGTRRRSLVCQNMRLHISGSFLLAHPKRLGRFRDRPARAALSLINDIFIIRMSAVNPQDMFLLSYL
jgi:hypothetical protein